MIVDFFGLYKNIINIIFLPIMQNITKNSSHGSLISNINIPESEQHDSVVKITNRS